MFTDDIMNLSLLGDDINRICGKNVNKLLETPQMVIHNVRDVHIFKLIVCLLIFSILLRLHSAITVTLAPHEL